MRRRVERFTIYLANLDPSRGGEMEKTRPVVVVSHEPMNRNLGTVVVCPLTTSLHPRWRSRIQCTCQGRKVEIAVDQIRAISKDRLLRRLDQLKAPLDVELRRLIVEMYGS